MENKEKDFLYILWFFLMETTMKVEWDKKEKIIKSKTQRVRE